MAGPTAIVSEHAGRDLVGGAGVVLAASAHAGSGQILHVVQRVRHGLLHRAHDAFVLIQQPQDAQRLGRASHKVLNNPAVVLHGWGELFLGFWVEVAGEVLKVLLVHSAFQVQALGASAHPVALGFVGIQVLEEVIDQQLNALDGIWVESQHLVSPGGVAGLTSGVVPGPLFLCEGGFWGWMREIGMDVPGRESLQKRSKCDTKNIDFRSNTSDNYYIMLVITSPNPGLDALKSRLSERRHVLGMTYDVLSERSGVALPTLKRILGSQPYKAAFEDVAAIAAALGVSLGIDREEDPIEMMRRQAHAKAERFVALVQGTSLLEAQGVDRERMVHMVQKTTAELMSGSKRRLWERV